MRWRKLGLLWAPDGRLPWAHSHAMLPTPMRLSDGRLRILLGVCDANIVSRVGWIDIHEKDPRRVINVAQEPVLDIGSPGHFDDNGVNPCCTVTLPDGSVRLYYVGYQLQRKIPYTLFTGLAQAPSAASNFQRVKPTPILDRGPAEPFFRTNCWCPKVMKSDLGDPGSSMQAPTIGGFGIRCVRRAAIGLAMPYRVTGRIGIAVMRKSASTLRPGNGMAR